MSNRAVFGPLGALALWTGAVAAGFVWLTRYESNAGVASPAPSDWPADVGLSPRPDSFNLVVAIHPRCPCSRATLGELERLLARAPERVHVHVLVWEPAGAAGWGRTPIAERAGRLPGAAVSADDGGRRARRFGAGTSGHVVLYGKDGRLLFSGGVTGSRGHEGDNPCLDALAERLAGRAAGVCETPVFGCPLGGPEES